MIPKPRYTGAISSQNSVPKEAIFTNLHSKFAIIELSFNRIEENDKQG